jgi:hypothetical protein
MLPEALAEAEKMEPKGVEQVELRQRSIEQAKAQIRFGGGS